MSEPANDIDLLDAPPATEHAGRRVFSTVRGYRLEVHERWGELNQYQRRRLQNGIGPERWPASRRRAIDQATGFRAAADVHDIDYCLGTDEAARRTGDRRMLRNMARIVLADAGGAMGLLIRGGWRQAFGRLVTAWIMYRALRRFGRPAFESATKH